MSYIKSYLVEFAYISLWLSCIEWFKIITLTGGFDEFVSYASISLVNCHGVRLPDFHFAFFCISQRY